jgi:hypothetical protein
VGGGGAGKVTNAQRWQRAWAAYGGGVRGLRTVAAFVGCVRRQRAWASHVGSVRGLRKVVAVHGLRMMAVVCARGKRDDGRVRRSRTTAVVRVQRATATVRSA